MSNVLRKLKDSGVDHMSRCYDLMMSTELVDGSDGVRYCDIIKPLDVSAFTKEVLWRYSSTVEKFHTDTEVRKDGEALNYHIKKNAPFKVHFGITATKRRHPKFEQALQQQNDSRNPLTALVSGQIAANSLRTARRMDINPDVLVGNMPSSSSDSRPMDLELQVGGVPTLPPKYHEFEIFTDENYRERPNLLRFFEKAPFLCDSDCFYLDEIDAMNSDDDFIIGKARQMSEIVMT